MNRQLLQGCFLIVIFLLVSAYPPAAFSREDTAYISFKRVGISKDQTDQYVVKQDEWLMDIIRDKYDVSENEISRILKIIKSINPELKNIDVIYPGQKLLLPRKHSSEAAGSAHSSPGVPSDEKQETAVMKYVVKRGDSISGIIYRQFGASRTKLYEILGSVKRLNPGIKNFDRIYPGQTLSLPRTIRDMVTAPFRDKEITIPEYKILPVVQHVVNRMYGVLVTEGSYCIPVPPSGEVTIDCSQVSVVEMPGGNIILLDLSNRIPADLKRIIEATWANYRVISSQKGEGIASILGRIIGATGIYGIEKVNRYEQVGATPVMAIFVEWLVSKRPQVRGADRYALNFVENSSQLVEFPVKEYAQRNGLEIIEIIDGLGVAADEKIYQPCSSKVLNDGSNVGLANSLLEMLGYSPVKNPTFEIVIGDGLTLSITADLLLDIEGSHILITSSSVSDQVVKILRKRGNEVVFISERGDRKGTIEAVMRAVKIPCADNSFTFPLRGFNGKESGNISLPALRLGEKELLYLVGYDVDREICGLLDKEYNVKLVRY